MNIVFFWTFNIFTTFEINKGTFYDITTDIVIPFYLYGLSDISRKGSVIKPWYERGRDDKSDT